MRTKLLKAGVFNPGDKKIIDREPPLRNVQFKVYKFNERPKPSDPKRVLIMTCFSEFGCESVAVHYCVPRLVHNFPGYYKVVVGWYGREYLYRHLVDEFWEMPEDCQWLREYSRAFHHESRNLRWIEKELRQHGDLIPSSSMANLCLRNNCKSCGHVWPDDRYAEACPKCGAANVCRSLFGDANCYKNSYVPVPRPSEETLALADRYLRPRSVGVFARGRLSYGRNLTPEFYEKLLVRLEQMGYNPIWLGERQSTLPCPLPRIVDFSRRPEAKNLELTLAIISKLEFTVQYWTASTRLAAMMGVPYLIFESPDQIIGRGQEGIRINLTSELSKKKLVYCHYQRVMADHEASMDLMERCVGEMKAGDWKDVIGLVDEPSMVQWQAQSRDVWSKS